MKVNPDVAPGYYLDPKSITFTFDPSVVLAAQTVNGVTPSMAKYIAYDTLTPPNPYIAVTQDGRGNVLYDGGFPKFYNGEAPIPGTVFDNLPPAFKYFYNALKWIANPAKLAAGNNKVLILGDANDGNYCIMYNMASSWVGFRTSIDNICAIAGFLPFYHTPNSYIIGQLDAPLSDLEDYCAVIVMSSAWIPHSTRLITERCLTDLVTYRENGNGIFIITDHGANTYTDIAEVAAFPVDGGAFHATANRLAVKFGCFFTGSYDRIPVNVGFLRKNYGDHPLYNNLLDTDNISAGPSESKVIVPVTPMINPNGGSITLSTNSGGLNTFQFLMVLQDGSIQTARFVYIIQSGEFVFFRDIPTGVEVKSIDVKDGLYVNVAPVIDGSLLGSIWGTIEMNDHRVGEVYYDRANGFKYYLYCGQHPDLIPVSFNIDTLAIKIAIPFTYVKQIPVTRRNVGMVKTRGAEFLMAIVAKFTAELTPNIPWYSPANVIKEIGKVFQPILPSGYTLPIDSMSGTIRMINDHYSDMLNRSEVTHRVYDTVAEGNSYRAANGVKVGSVIFIVEDNSVWGYLAGTWTRLPGLTPKQAVVAKRNIRSQNGTLYNFDSAGRLVKL